MKVIVVLIFLASLFSCNQDKKTSKKLIKSAINLVVSYTVSHPVLHTKQDTEKRNRIYIKAIGLLNKAMKIDNKSQGVYILKIMIFRSIQRYDSALTVAKQIYKLSPGLPITNIYTGIIYEEMGDTVLSKLYFKSALSSYNKLLAVNGKDAETFKHVNVDVDRAVLLTMLNRQQQGDSILNRLYAKEKDTLKKASIRKFMGKTKKEILADHNWY